jgi:hypothetical protein
MLTAVVAVGAFVMAVAIWSRLQPGKTDKDLVLDPDEQLLYECPSLSLVRYPCMGHPVSYPGSKIQITNKRVVFSQKGLLSERYVIREIAVREKNPPESLKGLKHWGLVSVFEYNQHDFSVTSKDQKTIVTFRNQFAPNLDRMEIVGVMAVEQLMQAIAVD